MKVLRLAWRNIWRNGRRTALSIGIVCVGTCALLMVWGFVSATFWGLRELTISSGIGNIQVGTRGSFDSSVYFQDPGIDPATARKVEDYVEPMTHVRFVMERVDLQGLVSFKQNTLSFVGTGIQPEKEAQLSSIFAPVIAGSDLPVGPTPHYNALVAVGLARSLGCRPGDTITLLVNLPAGGLNAVDVVVSGIYQTGFPATDKRSLLVPIKVAQELMTSKNVNRLVVSLDKVSLTDSIKNKISRRFPKLEVHGWKYLAPYYRQVVELYRNMFTVFGIIICIVVFLAIINTMLMSIMERVREIGTLLAIGIQPSFVYRVFVLEGGIIGILGGILGVFLTAVFAVAINSSGLTMPPAPGRTLPYPLAIFMDPASSSLVVGSVFVISCCAAFMASSKSTRMNVVDALAHT